MKKIALIYNIETGKTAIVAEKIQKAFGDAQIEAIDIEKVWKKDFEAYDNLIIGVATWFDGELPVYWDELIPELETLKLKNKKIALFGLGDQKEYPDNFVDGMGILAKIFEECGATIAGLTSTKGYEFNHSQALRGDQFLGLAIDFENQESQNEKRIKDWVGQLRKEFA